MMDQNFKEVLAQQFGAAIAMLENAIVACPDQLWDNDTDFWYWSYHTIFYLDYYADQDPQNFLPPSPYTLSEFNATGTLPERIYSKEELLVYLGVSRKKCHDLIMNFNPETAAHRFINIARNYSMLEIVLYNLRHVQHHVAQLNLLLRQFGAEVPKWVSKVKGSDNL